MALRITGCRVFRESLAVFLGCDGIGLSRNKIFWA
jgi:hypothetical protein